MMKESIILKGFVISVALLFFGTSATGTINLVHTLNPAPIFGNILYVGGVGPNNYTTIQDAINDATDGDSIFVYPGTYNEDQITVDKALKITGSETETTIIDGGGASLTSCGLVRIIANGDVTFQGFTVQNAGGPPNGGDYGDDLTNVGIYTQSDSTAATYVVSENKILGTNNPDDWEDFGFYTNSGKEHLIFADNTVTHTAANSLLIEKHLGSTEISDNTLDAGCWGIDPIYCMTYGGTDVTTLQKIDHNTIDVSTGVNPHGPTDNKITGIGFSSAYLGCTGSDDSGKYTNIEISNNTINNLQAYERGVALDNFAWGDGSGGEISGGVIQDNTFNGISTVAPSFGIRLSGLISGTVVQGNTITGCDMSFWGRAGYYGGSTAYPTGTAIHDNNFVGNGGGLVWEGAAFSILDAENDWWGEALGPHAPGNPGGTGDPISGNVDYTPWLLHPYGPPFAAFNYTIADKTVTFDASASGDYDGTITAYTWDFGDTMTGSGKNVSHTYAAYKTYTVSLTVTDNDDRTNTTSKTFSLGDVKPPIIMIRQPQPGYLYFTFWGIFTGKIRFFMTIVYGEITVIAEAYDNESGVNRVEFWIDSELRYTDDKPPYEWLWSEKGFFQRKLKAVAYDNAGNSAQDSLSLWKIQFK